MTQAVSQPAQPEEKQHRAIKTPMDGIILRIANKVGRSKAKEVERFLKFAMVGTLGAFVDLGTINLLQATILPPVDANGNPIGFALNLGGSEGFFPFNVALAATISFIAAITSNFFWNRYWTYPDSRSRSIRRQMSQFATVSTIGWLARTTWISISFATIGAIAVSVIQLAISDFSPDAETTARIGTNIATLMGIFIVMIWNFFANRYWTYNDVD